MPGTLSNRFLFAAGIKAVPGGPLGTGFLSQSGASGLVSHLIWRNRWRVLIPSGEDVVTLRAAMGRGTHLGKG
jgi:hypothetical protein